MCAWHGMPLVVVVGRCPCQEKLSYAAEMRASRLTSVCIHAHAVGGRGSGSTHLVKGACVSHCVHSRVRPLSRVSTQFDFLQEFPSAHVTALVPSPQQASPEDL